MATSTHCGKTDCKHYGICKSDPNCDTSWFFPTCKLEIADSKNCNLNHKDKESNE